MELCVKTFSTNKKSSQHVKETRASTKTCAGECAGVVVKHHRSTLPGEDRTPPRDSHPAAPGNGSTPASPGRACSQPRERAEGPDQAANPRPEPSCRDARPEGQDPAAGSQPWGHGEPSAWCWGAAEPSSNPPTPLPTTHRGTQPCSPTAQPGAPPALRRPSAPRAQCHPMQPP